MGVTAAKYTKPAIKRSDLKLTIYGGTFYFPAKCYYDASLFLFVMTLWLFYLRITSAFTYFNIKSICTPVSEGKAVISVLLYSFYNSLA